MSNFLTVDIGASRHFSIQVQPGSGLKPSGQWVTVKDGRYVTLGTGASGQTVELGVSDRRELRALRELIPREDMLWRVRRPPAQLPGEESWELTGLRPSRRVSFGGDVVIAWPEELGQPPGEAALVVTVPGPSRGRDRRILCVQMALLLEDGQEEPEVRLLTHDGRTVWNARLIDSVHHRHLQLEARECGEPAEGPVAFGSTWVELPPNGRVLFADTNSGLQMTVEDASALRAPPSPLLRAWLALSEIESATAAHCLEARHKPLPYTECREESGRWFVEIRTTGEHLRAWVGEEQGKLRRVRQAVLAKSVDAGEDSPSEFTLDSLMNLDVHAGTARGLLVPQRNRAATPPARGWLEAVDDKGRVAQAERRADALVALSRGEGANGGLVTWLLTPALAEKPHAMTVARRERLDNPTQLKATEGAIGCRDVFLIQGPPGTGKTSVIVSAIDELMARRGSTRRLRVLISSTQNDAVDNVVDGVRARFLDKVLVHRVPRDSAERAKHDRGMRDARRDLTAKLAQHGGNEGHGLALEEVGLAISRLESALADAADSPDQWSQSLDALSLPPLEAFVPLEAERGALRDALHALPRAALAPPAVPVHDSSVGHPLRLLLARGLDERALREAQLLAATMGDASGVPTDVIAMFIDLVSHAERAQRRGRSLAPFASEWEALRDRLPAAESSAAEQPARPPTPVDEVREALWRWAAACRTVWSGVLRAPAATPAEVRRRLSLALERSPSTWRDISERYADVVAATCQKAGDLPLDEPFDIAFIDEAGRASPLDLLIPMLRARRVVLVGDQQQLPPHVDDELLKLAEMARSLPVNPAEVTLFGRLFEALPDANRVRLNMQYRSHAVIGRLVSDLFYEGTVESWYSGARTAERAPQWGLFEDAPLVWIATGERGRDAHEDNDTELEFIDRILGRFRRRGADLRTARGPLVGVITFYRKQCERILELVSRHGLSEDEVQVGTVDSFQGKEFPLVILSTVKRQRTGAIGFLASANRANVAFSRAQRQLVVLGDAPTFERWEERNPGRASPYLEAWRRARQLTESEARVELSV